MKTKLHPRFSILATSLVVFTQLSTLNPQLFTAFAQGSAFTYQGRLNVNGAPASGSYDFRYRLAVDPYGNNYFGPTLLPSGQVISNGLFLATLDFGAGAFNGSNYWLEIAVRTNEVGAYTTLNPLQPVTPAPYAIFSGTSSNALNANAAASATTATTATAVGPNGVNTVAIQDNAVTSAKIASGQVVKSLTAGANTLYDNVTLAAGSNVTITPSGQTVTIAASAGGWSLAGNRGTTPGANFVGTTDNQPVEVRVDGQRALRLEPAGGTGAPNVIGGAPVNFVKSGVTGATIGGGGDAYNTWTNSVTGDFGTVGGGRNNIAVSGATVGGGIANTASGSQAIVGGGSGNTASNIWATVGGGSGNTASDQYATVSGGSGNTASNIWATVSGGSGNTASGLQAIVGGGSGNTASDQYATVSGGRRNIASKAHATVAGGDNNTANGGGATVGGGAYNQATNGYATVPGGYYNIAGGAFSFAAGQGAQALHNGAFVWSDGTASTASTGNNQFVVRASGGVIIYSPSGVPGIAWTSANGGSGSGLDADTLDGLHASSFLNTGNDYGRSGVAADLYEGPTKLGDKYLSKSGPGTISSGSSLQTLQVLNTGTGHGVYVESSTSTDNETGLKARVAGTSGNTFGIWGLTDSDAVGSTGSSAGVYGKSTRTGPVGDVFGVLGEINGAGGSGPGPNLAAGVYGVSYASSGLSVGVVGDSASSDPSGAGVFGKNKSLTGNTRGVWGEVSSPTGTGVYGRNPSSTGYGVYSNGRFEVAQSFSTLADSWATRSSKRWKTEITPIEGALDTVKRLNGVHFEWKESGKHDIGLIAEEVGKVIPEIVEYDENGRDAKSIDYGRIVSVLIEAVKEQQKEIDALRSELVTLKRK